MSEFIQKSIPDYTSKEIRDVAVEDRIRVLRDRYRSAIDYAVKGYIMNWNQWEMDSAWSDIAKIHEALIIASKVRMYH